MTPDRYQGNSGGPGDANNPQSWNKYAYTLGDPVNYFDPKGLLACNLDGCVDGDDDDDDGGGGQPFQPPSKPTNPPPPPIQCDLQLWADSAVTPSDPFKHTFLELTFYNPNTGISSVTTLEGGPVPKNPKRQDPLLLREWLNKFSSPGNSGGVDLFDFASEYSNGVLCADDAFVSAAFGNYADNTVSYNAALGPNSNTLTHWLLNHAFFASLPLSTSLELLAIAPGWFSAMPPNP
jgi:hypothetical protein